MGTVRIKKQFDRTIITRRLKKDEQISAMEIDIINRKEIPGLLPAGTYYRLGGVNLRFEVKDMMNLQTYLESGISLHSFCDTVRQIVDIFLNCQAHGIRTQNIELDQKCVFYRYASRKVQMIYWPVISPAMSKNERRFFRSLGEIYICSPKNRCWRKKYLDLFQSRERFDVEMLGGKVDELLREKERQEFARDAGTIVLNVPYLLEEKTKKVIELNRFPFVIGRRTRTCDYVIEGNGYIGREHVSLYQHCGTVFLHDCGSANGTTVNQKRIKPSQDAALETGSVIVLSDTEVYVFYAAGAIAELREME